MPILLATVHTEPADRERAMVAGADAYIAKPFNATVLLAAVADVLARLTQQWQQAASRPAAAGQAPHIATSI